MPNYTKPSIVVFRRNVNCRGFKSSWRRLFSSAHETGLANHHMKPNENYVTNRRKFHIYLL